MYERMCMCVYDANDGKTWAQRAQAIHVVYVYMRAVSEYDADAEGRRGEDGVRGVESRSWVRVFRVVGIIDPFNRGYLGIS